MLAVVVLYLCFTALMFLGSFILTVNHYPFFVAGVRFFGSGVILLSCYSIRQKFSSKDVVRQLWNWAFLKYALCLYAISALCFSWAMQYVDPVKACFVFVLAPFITALLLYVLHHEQLTRKKILGLCIGFVSVIPIILENRHGKTSEISSTNALLGYLSFAVATTVFAYGWILNKELLAKVSLPPTFVTGSALIVGGGTLLAGALLFDMQTIMTMQVTSDFWWLLLLLAILTAFGYDLYSKLLQRYSATFVSFASFLEPAFGLLYAALFLSQHISYLSFGALLGLGLGLYLFYQEELRLS